MSTNNKWFQVTRPKQETLARIICFPYAGAGPSVFNSWYKYLPENIELVTAHYPGRESRSDEALFYDLGDLVHNLCLHMSHILDKPYVFFGHSMGAYVAFELAKLLSAKSKPAPEQLYLSAVKPPHYIEEEPIHQLNTKSFLKKVIQLDGVPKECLESSEYMMYLLPILRADFASCERYRVHPPQAIDIPMTVLGGDNDPRVDQACLGDWVHHCNSHFNQKVFPGGHFYLNQHHHQIINNIVFDIRNY